MSIAGLKRTMRAVLARHRAQPRARTGAASQKAHTLSDIPAFARSKQAAAECAHCHFANNFRFQQLRAEGKFTKELLFQYPLPENIGITLDVDRNNVVKSIVTGSPAERAGVRPGDTVIRAGSVPVLSSGDLQFALESVPDPGSVSLELQRDGKVLPPMTLRLPGGWRRYDISWRPSQDGIAPQLGIWGAALDAEQKRQRGIPAEKLGLRVTFMFPGAQWAKTRGDLRMNDVIVGIHGVEPPHMTIRQFHSHFRLSFDVGDTVTLNVLRGGDRLAIRVPCVEVSEE
jgi:serine protease Do